MTHLRHLALLVPDLRAAESYYQPLFEMQLIGREAQLDDGLWYTLPFDKGWDDAEAAGIELGFVALRRDGFVLALVKGDAPPGQVMAIGLTLTQEELAEVRARLPAEAAVLDDRPNYLAFRDRYQINWQLALAGSEFSTAGVFAGRWIDL
jgi:catechol 2,3-dioxygenase-like lactoylglutathione lyase family enzyme